MRKIPRKAREGEWEEAMELLPAVFFLMIPTYLAMEVILWTWSLWTR